MPSRQPPDHRDPDATAGLRKRRRERGLPTGTDAPAFCPECGGPAIHGEVSHFVQMQQPVSLANVGPPQPAAATYTCERGHEWTLPVGGQR